MPRRAHKNKKYSNEFRKKAVEAYLRGEGSLVTLSKRFGIVHKETLREWVLWYNGHKEFKERSAAKGEIYMTKGRKTTQEERAKSDAQRSPEKGTEERKKSPVRKKHGKGGRVWRRA